MQEAAATGGVDPVEFRRVIGRFGTGVAIATTVCDGVHHAMTVNSLTSVSLDPVLVLICVDRTARFLPPLLDSGAWALSVLPADLEDASRWFASRSRPVENQLDGWRTTIGPSTGAAVFVDAIAVLECRTWATYDGGDHVVVVGEVLRADAPHHDVDPLLYYQGRYRGL